MSTAHRLGRNAAAIRWLLGAPCAFALNPGLDVSQYGHYSWRNRDGFVRGTIQDVVQTQDGYLWLAPASGLVRFEGVRAVPWEPPPDQPLPSKDILYLLAGYSKSPDASQAASTGQAKE